MFTRIRLNTSMDLLLCCAQICVHSPGSSLWKRLVWCVHSLLFEPRASSSLRTVHQHDSFKLLHRQTLVLSERRRYMTKSNCCLVRMLLIMKKSWYCNMFSCCSWTSVQTQSISCASEPWVQLTTQFRINIQEQLVSTVNNFKASAALIVSYILSSSDGEDDDDEGISADTACIIRFIMQEQQVMTSTSRIARRRSQSNQKSDSPGSNTE